MSEPRPLQLPTMSPRIVEALRRLRDLTKANFDRRYPSARRVAGKDRSPFDQWFDDCRAVADWTLLSHHHDDDEPIDSAWLESVGFEPPADEFAEFPVWTIEPGRQRLPHRMQSVNVIRLFDGSYTSAIGTNGVPGSLETRAEVRSVCRAAGFVLSTHHPEPQTVKA